MPTPDNNPTSFGISFFEDSPNYDHIFGDQLVPSGTDSLIFSNVIEVLTHQGVDLQSKEQYISYLEHYFDIFIQNQIPIPHKAWIQLEMTKLGINESLTRIIPTSDFPTAIKYTMELLAKGHTDIWWGTADIDDHSDPQGKQNISPPLYKHIKTFRDILLNLACAKEFADKHPNCFLKVFPQDGPKPAIGSLVVAENNTGGKLFHLKIRKNEYTTSERQAGDDKPITISIDYEAKPPRIFTNQNTQETLHWLQIMINSDAHFKKLDQIKLTGSDYNNAEFLIFLNGQDTAINFFTDIIWGSKSEKLAKTRCPRIHPIIQLLQTSLESGNYLMIPESFTGIFDSSNQFMHAVLNTVQSARKKTFETNMAAKLIINLIELHKLGHVLDYVIPTLNFRTIQLLESFSRGNIWPETEEIIQDLQNQLII